MAKDASCHVNGDNLFAFLGHRTLCNEIVFERQAVGGQGTGGTIRVLGTADQGTQFHEGLVEFPGPVRGKQLFCPGPEDLFGLGAARDEVDIEQPGQDAFDVGIHHRNITIVGNGGNGSCCVRAYSRESAQEFPADRDLSLVFGNKNMSSLEDVFRPGVISQALPAFQHPVFRGDCQAFQIGKFCHPASEKKNNPIHLGLLQHDLGDPDLVGGIGLSPRQVTLIGCKPGEQGFLEGD